MTTRQISLIALIIIISGMAIAASLDADDKQERHIRYCTDVVTWQVEALQGIPPEHRTGHPDYRGNAAEVCPGMRPAQ